MSPFCESAIPLDREALIRFLFGSRGDHGENQTKAWLAVSGGLDSMVLLDLFADWAKSMGQDLEVLHVNYGLRGEESEGDALFVQDQAKARGVACRVLRVPPGSQPTSGIQDWARQIRYKWFADVARAPDKVLLAHHQDDQIETILMRIMRGSGLSGLQGMKAEQGVYWRPFLAIPQKSLQEIAVREKILHREDSSNAKLDYSRNRIRKLILPELEEMFPGAGRNLTDLAEAGQEWDRFHRKTLLELDAPTTADGWRDLGFHPAAQWLLERMKSLDWTKGVSRSWLETVYKGLIEGKSTVIQLDPEHQVRLDKGILVLERKEPGLSPRWRQYAKELTRSSLSALLSADARAEAILEDSLGKQEKSQKS